MSAAAMKILSVCSIFPNVEDSAPGGFVKTRLEHVASLAEVKVLAPVPMIDYSAATVRALWRGFRLGAAEYAAGPMEVLHPRWLYAPGGSFLNPLCLSVRLAPAMLRLQRRFPFDIIDSHFGYPDGVAVALVCAWLRRPFSVTLRGSELYHGRSAMLRRWMGWSLRRASVVIVQSEELGQFAVRLGAHPGRVKKIPNGIDRAIYFPRDREVCRIKNGLDPRSKIVVSAGHLRELKGHQFTIRAFEALYRHGEADELLIAGDAGTGAPSYEPELRRLAAELKVEKQVRLVGRLAPGQLAELMSAADVFCLASTREGWPNVIQEALACGCPAVSTDVGAVGDMISSPGYGIIVPPSDAAVLEQALRRALATRWDRQAISVWGQTRSWSEVARQVVGELRSAVAEYAAYARNQSTASLLGDRS